MQADDDDHKVNVITLCQQKGGVGKTTTAACLGAELANMGSKCLLLDLAPSGNLTSAFGIQPNQVERTTADLFHGDHSAEELIKPTPIQGLNLIPANASLAPITRELYQKPDDELVLQKILQQDQFMAYTYIIIDCPPDMDAITLNAIASTDLVILPLECEPFALQTLENMFRLIKLSRERANPYLSYRLLITKKDQRNAVHKRIHAQIKNKFNEALLKTFIEVDHRIPESQLSGIPLVLSEPQSLASQQYHSLTKEILEIIMVNHKSKVTAQAARLLKGRGYGAAASPPHHTPYSLAR